jgi:Tfp pilus assembly protein FimV
MTSDTDTAPALEEAEAALTNMDPRVASILRRRMGLAPVEPEPSKVEPAPETSARAAIREQLVALTAPAPAIDPEALQRLDAEIAEKAKAEQEAQARAQQEAAQVAKAQGEAVTAALEPIKARARTRLSPTKRRMIESSVRIGVADREHKSQEPRTSVFSGPDSLRISGRSGPHYVRMGLH